MIAFFSLELCPAGSLFLIFFSYFLIYSFYNSLTVFEPQLCAEVNCFAAYKESSNVSDDLYNVENTLYFSSKPMGFLKKRFVKYYGNELKI